MSEPIVQFFAHGVPVTQGSKRIVGGRGKGKPRMIEASSKLAGWRSAIGWKAKEAMQGCTPVTLDNAIEVDLTFTFARPAKPSRSYPCTSGGKDVDKLVRAALDAMTGIVWVDDSQVVQVNARKSYGESPGVDVEVRTC